MVGCRAPGEKEAVGTLVGAAGGGVIGAHLGHGQTAQWTTGTIGVIGGAGIGNAIGRKLDQLDEEQARIAFRRATQVPVGEVVYWNNTRTGNWGSYKPLREGHSRIYGNYCREFVTQGMVDGRPERLYGTACRAPNGTWELIN